MEAHHALAFDQLSKAVHPGTMNGFAGELSANLERYVNAMVLHCNEATGHAVDTQHRHNSLAGKLRFLAGNDAKLYAKSGSQRWHRLQQPWISAQLFRFLSELREQRNAHVHGSESVYGLISQLGDFLITGLPGASPMLFCPNASEPGLVHYSSRTNKVYPCELGKANLCILDPALPHRTADLELGNEMYHDLMMHLFTKQGYEQWCAERQFRGAEGERTGHYLVILWGKHAFSWALPSGGLTKVTNSTRIGQASKKILYFRFRVSTILERLVELQRRGAIGLN